MRGGLAMLLSLGALFAGCASHGILAADGAAALVDATEALAESRPPALVDATEALAESRPPACTPGADQTCNDDPTISSLWGTCEPSGVCACQDGFSVDPATGRCRPGQLCEASAADSWPVVLRLEPANCTMPDTVPCDADSGTADDVATTEVRNLAASCLVPPHTRLRVEVVFGCPTSLDLAEDLTSSIHVQCLIRLLRVSRWSCAGDMACALLD